MDYRQFSAVDLATDATFIGWVLQPDRINTAFWETYLAQHPDRADTLAEARQLVTGWQISPPVPSAGSREEVWRAIRAGTSETLRPRIGLLRFIGDRAAVGRYAAVFLGIMAVAAAWFWLVNQTTPTHYATGNGETKTITLPDNSTVVLAANSSLSVLGDWTTEQPRELTLTGEGYFAVTHQQNHRKFIVRTADHLRVEVLGTRFTVTERSAATQVVLNAGKVALYVDKDNQPLLMKPGELIEVPTGRSQRGPIVRRRVTPEVYSAWTDNEFVFEDTSLGEIAMILEREFDQKIVFANPSLKALRVTLRLPNRDLGLLLTALAEIHELTIDRQSDQILIGPAPNPL